MSYTPKNPNGQATMANSSPVVLSSDQSAVTIADGGGAITVDGTVAVTNAGLTALNGAIAGTEVQVDVLTMPTVTVTATNLDVQSGGADLATSAQGAAIQTATELIDDAVFVDDADRTDNTSKHINVGGVYQSAPHTVTDGDVTPFLTDVNGRQVVTGTVAVTQSGTRDEVGINDSGNSITVDGTVGVSGTVTVDGSGVTQPVSNAGLTELAAAINGSSQMDVNIASSAISFGGTSAADDADFTVGVTDGTPVMGVYDSTPDTVTDGDLGVIGINSTRAVRTVIEAGSASIGVVDLGATDNAVLDAIAASVASSDTSLNDIEAALETAGGLVVNLGANNDVTVTGTVDLGATDNAVLDAIAASTAAIDTDTTTIIGHLDGVEGLLTTIDGDTSNLNDTVKTLGTDTYTEATTKGVLIGGVRRDADTTLVNTTNEVTPFQLDANGRLKVEAFSGETLPVSLTSTTVTGTVAVTQSGTWDEVGINDSGNSITVDAPIGTPVNVQIGNATLAAGVIDETGASAVDALAVGGGTANDAVDSGNPIKLGFKAYNFDGTAAQTAVAEADRVNGISDTQGIQYVQISHPAFFHVSADYASAQTNVSVKAAPGAGSIFITDIMLSNGATAGNVTLLDGSGGTVLRECYPAINGGAVLNLRNPIKLTATTALCLTSTTVTTHSIFIAGFIA